MSADLVTGPVVAPPAIGRKVVPVTGVAAGRRSAWRSVVPLAVGSATAGVGLAQTSTSAIGALGLLPALAPLYWLGVAVVVVGALLSFPPRYGIGVTIAHAVVLIVLLHGAPAFVEAIPRFPVAYLHAGFADYVARTHHALPPVDARASWPGFFDLAGYSQQLMGVAGYTEALRWSGVVLNIAYLAPVMAITRAVRLPAAATAASVLLFPMLNWVGQDYFSPQALAYLLYLTVLALLLARFRRRPGRDLPGLGAIDRLHVEEPESEWPSRSAAMWTVAAVLVLIAACVVSHQLTPVLVVVASAGLVLTGRCSLRGLPIVTGVGALSFFSYLAVPYWRGHLRQVFGGVGDVSTNLQSGVSSRVHGSSAHLVVVDSRLALTGLVALAALAACWRLFRRRQLDPAVLIIGAAAAPLVVLQSYGGEAVLRAYLFALPAAVVLIAAAAAGRLERSRAVRGIAVATLLLLTPLFVLSRFGNEEFERVRPGELQAVQWVYSDTPPGSAIVLFNEFNVSGFVQARAHRLFRFPPAAGPAVLGALPQIATTYANYGTYLILSTAQVQAGIALGGLPTDWGSQVLAQLRGAAGAQEVFTSADARVFRIDPTFQVSA